MTIKQNGGIFGRNPTFNDVTADTVQVVGANENSLFYSDASGNLQTSSDLTWDTGALGALNVGAQAYIQTTSSTDMEVGGQYGKIIAYKSGSGQGALDFYCYSGGIYKTMELDRLGNLILTNGNLAVPSGNGIDFSATSGTGTSELFDDYEEGTWTPVLSDGTNNAGGYNIQSGFYTKIGREVFIRLYLRTTSLGSVSGNVIITGLPYTSASTSSSRSSLAVGFATGLAITAGQSVTAFVEENASFVVLNLFDATTGTSALQDTEWTNDGRISITGSYMV